MNHDRPFVERNQEPDGLAQDRTYGVPAEDLRHVLSLPLAEQRAAARRLLAPAEFALWRELWEVLNLPRRHQFYAALRLSNRWAFEWWATHRQQSGRSACRGTSGDKR